MNEMELAGLVVIAVLGVVGISVACMIKYLVGDRHGRN